MINKISNSPISFDFHGDSPLTKPFQEFTESDISFYIDLDTIIGKDTCGQACEHCWFVSNEKVKNKSFDVLEGKLITDGLTDIGYNVYPRYTDTFAYNGDFMKLYGPANNREFRQDLDKKETDTMLYGDAWTSGKPLLADNYVELLDIAYESGYRTVSITYHGIIDENLEVIVDKKYPIKGVFSGKNSEKVFERIFKYNEEKDRNFRINIGITIGTHNNTKESLLRYALYFNKMGVDTVRFNNFTDHGGKHGYLELSIPETEQVYKDIKWLNENIELKFQIGVSEDFGTFGIEVMGFPKEVGLCQAGHQFFTIIPAEEALIDSTDEIMNEKIGDIVGCVNIFEPYFGSLVRTTDKINNTVSYGVDVNAESINEFNEKRTTGVYLNGCYAKELKHELANELSSNLELEAFSN